MNSEIFPRRRLCLSLVCGFACMVVLAGCVAPVDRPREGSVYEEPPVAGDDFVASDDYVYYPNYGVYYSSRRHQYFGLEGGAWVSRPAPRGVPVGVLLASPSVRMNFHDSPANHHAAMVRQYPHNWKPSGPPQGRRDEHGH